MERGKLSPLLLLDEADFWENSGNPYFKAPRLTPFPTKMLVSPFLIALLINHLTCPKQNLWNWVRLFICSCFGSRHVNMRYSIPFLVCTTWIFQNDGDEILPFSGSHWVTLSTGQKMKNNQNNMWLCFHLYQQNQKQICITWNLDLLSVWLAHLTSVLYHLFADAQKQFYYIPA